MVHRGNGQSGELRQVSVVALATLVLAFTGDPSAAQNETDEEGIVWANMMEMAVGDFWTYQLTGEEQGDVQNEVVATETYSGYWEVEYETFKIHSQGEISSDQALGPVIIEIDAFKWVRRSDYAAVELKGEARVQGAETHEVFEAYDPALVEIVFPFTKGYEWNAKGKWKHNEVGGDGQIIAYGDLPESINLRAKVHGLETVTVPAGTFQAWKIEYVSYRESSNTILRWWVPEVCELVKEQRFDAERRLLTTMELTAFSCAARTMEQPTYDTGNVTLLNRGVAGGSTGATIPNDPEDRSSPSPTVAERSDAESTPQDTGQPWLWPAVAAAAAASVLLVWVGRRRLG